MERPKGLRAVPPSEAGTRVTAAPFESWQARHWLIMMAWTAGSSVALARLRRYWVKDRSTVVLA